MTTTKQFIIVRLNPSPTPDVQCQRYSVTEGWVFSDSSASVFDAVTDAMANAPHENGVRIEDWRTRDVIRRWIDGGWK